MGDWCRPVTASDRGMAGGQLSSERPGPLSYRLCNKCAGEADQSSQFVSALASLAVPVRDEQGQHLAELRSGMPQIGFLPRRSSLHAATADRW